MGYPHECFDPETWPWNSAKDHVVKALRFELSPHICTSKSLVLDDLKVALQDLNRDIRQGICNLFKQGSQHVATLSDSAGCGCVGLKEVWDRTLDPESIYFGLRDHTDFETDGFMTGSMWKRSDSCTV